MASNLISVNTEPPFDSKVLREVLMKKTFFMRWAPLESRVWIVSKSSSPQNPKDTDFTFSKSTFCTKFDSALLVYFWTLLAANQTGMKLATCSNLFRFFFRINRRVIFSLKRFTNTTRLQAIATMNLKIAFRQERKWQRQSDHLANSQFLRPHFSCHSIWTVSLNVQ